jgi:hypothetical protein
MTNKLTQHRDQVGQLIGQQVTKVITDGVHQLTLLFAGGAALGVEWHPEGLLVQVTAPARATAYAATAHRPTKRQLDYLLFIHKYIARYGRGPAESDIEQHFLVSAPSVNQMMQTLERRGFISRQLGVPRSARLCIELPGKV